MKHLGDICNLKGESVPIVDIVVGGSPCQDLSVAGKRAGLDGERSGLFNEMEYISKDDITALIESYKDRIALNIPEILRDINELETKTIGGQNNDNI